MQKDGTIPVSYFPELQHIYMGIAFHRRAQAVSRLERTFWLKEETPATVNLDGKEQQKGDMNSKYCDKIKRDFLHTKGGIALLLQRALVRRIPVKIDGEQGFGYSRDTKGIVQPWDAMLSVAFLCDN